MSRKRCVMLSLMTVLLACHPCFCTSTPKKEFPIAGISVLTFLKPILITEGVTKIAVILIVFI